VRCNIYLATHNSKPVCLAAHAGRRCPDRKDRGYFRRLVHRVARCPADHGAEALALLGEAGHLPREEFLLQRRDLLDGARLHEALGKVEAEALTFSSTKASAWRLTSAAPSRADLRAEPSALATASCVASRYWPSAFRACSTLLSATSRIWSGISKGVRMSVGSLSAAPVGEE
jgi:hypothetical protein